MNREELDAVVVALLESEKKALKLCQERIRVLSYLQLCNSKVVIIKPTLTRVQYKGFKKIVEKSNPNFKWVTKNNKKSTIKITSDTTFTRTIPHNIELWEEKPHLDELGEWHGRGVNSCIWWSNRLKDIPFKEDVIYSIEEVLKWKVLD